ncbi:MAG: DUF1269 domain-containing protein [Actinomycetota bacterium]
MADTEILIIEVENKAQGDLVLDEIEIQEKHHQFTVDDAAMAYRNDHGDVKLRQTKDMTGGKGAGIGAGVGLLAGLVIGGPIALALLGTAAGGLAAGLGDKGIPNDLMKQLESHVQNGHALVFVQLEKSQAPAFADFAVAQAWQFHRQDVRAGDHTAVLQAHEEVSNAGASA